MANEVWAFASKPRTWLAMFVALAIFSGGVYYFLLSRSATEIIRVREIVQAGTGTTFYRFVPPVVEIAVGDTVTWIWDMGLHEEHSTKSDTGIWDSGLTMTGEYRYSSTFTAGTLAANNGSRIFPYHCFNHGSPGGSPLTDMVGVVRVNGNP